MDQKKFEEFVAAHADFIWTKEANVRGRHGKDKLKKDINDQMIITRLKPSCVPCGTCNRMRPDSVAFDIVFNKTNCMWIWKCQSCSWQTNPVTGQIQPLKSQYNNHRPRDPVTGRLIKSE
jgi:hypothetical protein